MGRCVALYLCAETRTGGVQRTPCVVSRARAVARRLQEGDAEREGGFGRCRQVFHLRLFSSVPARS